MMEDNDWLKGLQSKMKDYEEPAPEGLWENVESSVFPEKKRRVIALPILWRSVGVAAAVALGVFAGLRFFDSPVGNPSDRSQEILASGQPSSVNDNGGRESSVEIVRKTEPEKLLAESIPVRKRQAKAHVVNNVKSDLVEENVIPEAETKEIEAQPYTTEESLQGNHAEPQTQRQEEEISGTKKTEENEPVVISTDHDDEDWSDYISVTGDSRTSRRRAAALDVSLSGGSVDSRDENSYDLQMFYRGSAPASTNGLIDDSKGSVGNDAQVQTRGMAPMQMKSGSTVTSSSDHKRPVRLALAVNIPVSGTFGLETGAMLTSLHSTFTTEAGRTRTETEQTLRYLGIPLNMTASLRDWSSDVCSSDLGMVEKCISGKSASVETLAGVKQGDSVKKNLNVKPLLWSLNASAGLQANLTKNIGLYVEPGLSYHFDDKSDVRTIYKDRPLDFMLTFGARISLK